MWVSFKHCSTCDMPGRNSLLNFQNVTVKLKKCDIRFLCPDLMKLPNLLLIGTITTYTIVWNVSICPVIRCF